MNSLLPLESSCGVYQIKNLVDGKLYVGSSKNLKNRFYNHHNQLKNKCHHSVRLQRAWDKHGEASFEASVITYCEEGSRFEIEQSLISETKSYDPSFGYNMLQEVASLPVMIFTDEMRAAAAERMAVRNTANARKYSYLDSEYTIQQLAELSGINSMTIRHRMNVQGLTAKEALDLGASAKSISYEKDGVTQSATGWTKELGAGLSLISSRKKRGWNKEDLLLPLQVKTHLIGEESLTLHGWALKYNMCPKTLWHRVNKMGMKVEDALIYDHSKKIEYGTESLTLSEWADKLGLKMITLYNRVYSYGWTLEKALSRPVGHSGERVTFNGETLTYAEWASKIGVSYQCIRSRLLKGWPIEKALTAGNQRLPLTRR